MINSSVAEIDRHSSVEALLWLNLLKVVYGYQFETIQIAMANA